MSWKSVLYEYVHTRNQMEVEYSLAPILSYTIDERYLQMQENRLNQLRTWHGERRVIPIKNETRLKICNVVEKEGRIVADIALKKLFHYNLKQVPHKEERIEREYVTLTPANGSWLIAKITPDLSETRSFSFKNKLPSTVPDPSESPALFNEFRAKSTPYLNQHVFSSQATAMRRIQYNRYKAAQYADTWWSQVNPQYIEFEVDCTNYISQCLFAGGAPMNYTGKRETGWWYHGKQHKQELWSFSWAVANSFTHYLSTNKSGLQADVVDSAEQLTIGDVINYDWEGDSRFTHSTMVTAFDADGRPLVNAHTTNSRHRYWDYRDSYAWTPRTQYRFLHIADYF